MNTKTDIERILVFSDGSVWGITETLNQFGYHIPQTSLFEGVKEAVIMYMNCDEIGVSNLAQRLIDVGCQKRI